ncbi:unnamed protein product [Chironomus riparius]|uniref:Cytochrome P450 n=1 Tax=Chironomus riparius TaxID=315576 RepID=A0A9N9RX61_9DIPT|nr:unnamed protein product [Chironomus riparius]
MIVLIILIFSILFWIIKYFWDHRRFYYLAYKIPTSSFDYSFSGIYKFFTADNKTMLNILNEILNNENEIVKIWLGHILLVVANNPDDIKTIFNAKQCYDKPSFVKVCAKIEKGSLFGYLEYWRSHRKVMNPFFGLQGLKALIPIFNDKSKIFIKNLEKMIDKEAFNIFHNMTALTLETILKVMEYDVDIQNQESKTRDVFIMNLDTSNCAMAFTNDIVQYVRNKTNNNEDEQHKSFIQAMVNPRNDFTDDEIKDEVHSIVLAGQDTSAIASSMTLLVLAVFKDVQQKVVDELYQVFGKTRDTPYIEFENVNELVYLEMVINEVMRLYPVVPFVVRQVDEEIVLGHKYTIPVKAAVVVPISRVHKNKKYWGDDAEEFNPERFSKENISKIHPYAFVPFAKGPRMCLGYRYAMMLMKIQLANFLMRYEVDTDLKLNELEFCCHVTMTVCQGYMIKVRNRKC